VQTCMVYIKPQHCSFGKDHDWGLIRMKENIGANKQLFTPIELLIKESSHLGPEELAKRIVNAVSSTQGISYSVTEEISLLTAPARVLITIVQQPRITVRALAIYLGVSEAAVLKSLKMLLDNNLIAKTKVNGKNNYSIVKESFEKHSDITHLLAAAGIIEKMGQSVDDDDIFQ
jgi:predicted transcriptional regulator